MKSIGLATIYNKINYGTVLQAYATQKILDQQGYLNYTIDTRGFKEILNRRKWKYFLLHIMQRDMFRSKKGFLIKKLLVRVNYKGLKSKEQERKVYFEEFVKNNIRFTPAFSNIEDLKRYTKDNYNIVVVGSDQIWLPQHIYSGYYTLEWVPESVKKVSLATSFGKSTLSKDLRGHAEYYLSKFNYISVREQTGKDIVYDVIKKDVKVICDPTMMLTGQDWENLLISKEKRLDKYIFCYFLGKNPKHREFAKELKKHTGYKIIALIHMDEYVAIDESYADETPFNVGPIDFLDLINQAEYVLTDSFHASVFSVIFQKLFWVFNRFDTTNKMSTNNRILTLLTRLDLQERLVVSDFISDYNRVIDYEKVNGLLDEIRKEAIEYIKMSLGEFTDQKHVGDLLKHECVGCTACIEKCPMKCIKMEMDKEGFFYPHVDLKKCIGCGLCLKSCTSVNKAPKQKYEQKAYLVQNKDLNIRNKSNSGGFFSALAEAVIKEDGVVFGAAFTPEFHVHHKGIVSIEEIEDFRGSKYVQSDMQECYKEAKKYLDEGRLVLFSGTPCQIEGLSSFLNGERDNLILVDVVCRGTPSPQIWEKYIRYIKEKHMPNVSSASFRDKLFYGYTYSQMSITDDTNVCSLGGVDNNPYLRSFFENVNVRPSCFTCKFRSRYRNSDFTIWDCLDIENYTELLDKKGTTRVLIHTCKGGSLFSDISQKFKFLEIDADVAVNDTLEMKSSKIVSSKRNDFFESVQQEENIENVFDSYFNFNFKIMIEHWIRVFSAKTGLYSRIKKIRKKLKR